jgi:hypothetical protein
MKKMNKTLREHVESLQPLTNSLRELERDAEGLMAQWAGVPTNVHRDYAPDQLLEAVQRRIDERYAALIGAPVRATFVTPDVIRNVLHMLQQLAELGGAVGVDTTALPQRKGFRVWTGDGEHYVDAGIGRGPIGGVHELARVKFDARIRPDDLHDDGSVKK